MEKLKLTWFLIKSSIRFVYVLVSSFLWFRCIYHFSLIKEDGSQYYLPKFNSLDFDDLWLCQVTLFVIGWWPKYIYVLDWDKEITTSVDNVKAGELSICPMKNGAIFTCAEDVKVNLFDLNGRLVKNFNLNGSEFVELAAGIYIANGKKFIVK